MSEYPVTQRSKIKRRPQRAIYDRDQIHAFLDAGLIAHVAFVTDGQPYVLPTAYWREGDTLYWHGSSAGRFINATGSGVPICFCVTHFDGLVMGRSGFFHSANYRTVVAFGNAEMIEDDGERTAALDAFVERVVPGRSKLIRKATVGEDKAVGIVRMVIKEATAKTRSGGPNDPDEDRSMPLWAGILPIRQVIGAAIVDPKTVGDFPMDYEITKYSEGASLEALMTEAARRQHVGSETGR